MATRFTRALGLAALLVGLLYLAWWPVWQGPFGVLITWSARAVLAYVYIALLYRQRQS